ncbi:larval cuticle protein A2B-like [Condylostylus longicornis]|uniref:larval cuticle protein A2B-like n=1 Tax=Condylostylus longicornis TaxID=2530218 RepID=UPI00244DD464|nr:larval cuticle protein A2B-like [Condylostylus longicornis]
MAYKIIAVLAFATIVSAGVYHHDDGHHAAVAHHGPVLHYVADHGHHEHHDDHSAPQPYDFKYGVHDSHTGDVKDQHETADGHGNVHGSYSLVDADGFKRTVKYSADPHNGFNAEVHREPLGHHAHVIAAPAAHYAHDDHHGHHHHHY